MKRIAIVAAVGMLVAGCSAGPSKSSAQDALAEFYEQGAGIKPQLNDFALGNCEKQEGSPGYACSASGEAVFAVGNRTQREQLAGTFVFDKVGSTWKVVGTR